MRAWKIYCGRGRLNGPPVTDAEVRAFINASIRPRFDAFTIQHVRGYWHATSERSFVIEIIHASDWAQASVAEIAADYKRRFGQDAVLVVGNGVESVMV
jgi:hypothetical protein